MGNFAKAKKKFIKIKKNIVECSHPSPLSANKGGFFGLYIFKKVETKLGFIINWQN
jgi:uracil DNA glycosylase